MSLQEVQIRSFRICCMNVDFIIVRYLSRQNWIRLRPLELRACTNSISPCVCVSPTILVTSRFAILLITLSNSSKQLVRCHRRRYPRLAHSFAPYLCPYRFCAKFDGDISIAGSIAVFIYLSLKYDCYPVNRFVDVSGEIYAAICNKGTPVTLCQLYLFVHF